MLAEIMLGATAYSGGGLLVARQVKFHMENVVDRMNDGNSLMSEHQKWLNRHRGHRIGSGGKMCLNCIRDDYSPAYDKSMTTMKSRYGDGVVGWPILHGVLYPLTIPGMIVGKVGLEVARGVAPAAKWFFENPRHRKARRNKKSEASVVK